MWHDGIPASAAAWVGDEHPYACAFVTVSGAHLYGFPSVDSDVDLRDVHLLPLDEIAGLEPARETVSWMRDQEGVELDLVTHDAHHYLGFARHQWALFGETRRLKPLLYTFRVLLTGIHLTRTGQVVADLNRLTPLYGPDYLPELIEAKRAAEKGGLPADAPSARRLEADVAALTQRLERERDASSLPDQPSAHRALHDLVVRTRLAYGSSHTGPPTPRAAVVAALLDLSKSADHRDRVDAGKALAPFVDDSSARHALVALLADDADTMVTVEVAGELMRRHDSPGLAAVAAGLSRADPNHADWIYTAAANVFMIYVTERDAALRVCSALANDPDPHVSRGADSLAAVLAELNPVLRPE